MGTGVAFMTYATVERLKALGEDEFTYGNTLGPAMSIIDPDEAQAYFRALVDEYERRGDVHPEKSVWMAKVNLGYYAGYYDSATMDRVYQLYQTQHPYFGTRTDVGVAETYLKGVELAGREVP